MKHSFFAHLSKKYFSPLNTRNLNLYHTLNAASPNRIRWLSDDDVIIADSTLPHIQIGDKFLNSNGSLEVINVQLNDTGNYICEVTVGYRVFRQVHAIEVQGE